MPEEMKTWCEDILTPINKLFTHFRKRRADAQEESHAHRHPLHPPCHQGIMLLGWSSSRPGGLEGTGDEALPWPQPRAGSGLLHLDVAEDPAHTPDVCRHTAGPAGTRRSTEDGAAPEASTNHMCDGGQGAATRAVGPSESPPPLKDGASESGRTPVGVSVTSLRG